MSSSLAEQRNGTRRLAVPVGMVRAGDNVVMALRPITGLLLRVALAIPFFRSGLTKWDGFLDLSPSAVFLFREEYKLHMFGKLYDFPVPQMLAPMAGVAEIALPILLVLGLATRFAAFGLLIMTGIIQLVYPDAWAAAHLPWAAMAFALMTHGPGAISLDRLIGGRFIVPVR